MKFFDCVCVFIDVGIYGGRIRILGLYAIVVRNFLLSDFRSHVFFQCTFRGREIHSLFHERNQAFLMTFHSDSMAYMSLLEVHR
jgi:hypothetical protein